MAQFLNFGLFTLLVEVLPILGEVFGTWLDGRPDFLPASSLCSKNVCKKVVNWAKLERNVPVFTIAVRIFAGDAATNVFRSIIEDDKAL